MNEYNFDHPDAFDMDLLLETLRKLKEGRKVEVPVYNFITHSRESNTVRRIIIQKQNNNNNNALIMFVIILKIQNTTNSFDRKQCTGQM